ncbi:MAG: hypothetical protein KF724_02365 [Phycisphaeraceae bacterium]|nr:hypothetical protein [Phycisphaeraceae bacterium]
MNLDTRYQREDQHGHRLRTVVRPHRRGAALLLVLFALAVVGTAGYAFVAGSDHAVMTGRTAASVSEARVLADSSLAIAKEILKSSDTKWRTKHTNGMLLTNYALDGGTVSIQLVDINKRAANPGGNSNPDQSTTEVEIIATSIKGGSRFRSVAQMSLPMTNKGQYAIFANKFMIFDGTNFVGRWQNAPASQEKLRVNIGTQAETSWAGSNGVFINATATFEPDYTPPSADDPCLDKATWIYYPFNASSFTISGAGANKICAKKLAPDESIKMIPPPPAPAFAGGTTQWGGITVNGTTVTYTTPFRLRQNTFLGFPWGPPADFTMINGATVTLKSGIYRIDNTLRIENSKLIIDGDVTFVADAPFFTIYSMDLKNAVVELKDNSTFNVFTSYGVRIHGSWIGRAFNCAAEGNAAKKDGDPHRKAWFGQWSSNACSAQAPTEPMYMEPWRFRIYPVPAFLSNFFTWDILDSSVVGSLFLPTNPIQLRGNTKVWGRVAANHVVLQNTASVYYDHALDLIDGLTEGAPPGRGGDPNQIWPVRVTALGFEAE